MKANTSVSNQGSTNTQTFSIPVLDKDALSYMLYFTKNSGYEFWGQAKKGLLTCLDGGLVKMLQQYGGEGYLEDFEDEPFFRCKIHPKDEPGEWYLYVHQKSGDLVILNKDEENIDFLEDEKQPPELLGS